MTTEHPCGYCTLCKKRDGLVVPEVVITHDEPKACTGDCDHCKAVLTADVKRGLGALVYGNDDATAVEVRAALAWLHAHDISPGA